MVSKELNTEHESNYQEDEIDLFEFWNVLVEEKKTILISFLSVLVLAIAYLLLAIPAYKSTAYLLPPLEKDIQEMNSLALLTNNSSSSSSSSSVNTYTSEDVFNQFLVNLSSRSLRHEIFDKYHLKDIYVSGLSSLSLEKQKAVLNKALESFSKDFSLTRSKVQDKDNQEVSVSLTVKQSPGVVAQMVNDAVEIATKNTASQIYNSILSEYYVRVAQLDDKIESLRKTAKDRRLDKIARLNEAINVAKSMNMANPKEIGQSVTVNTDKASDGQGMPLYFLGYKLLEAQKKTLESRNNDDPFIAGLREYQEQLEQLKSLTIDKKAFGVARVDQYAYAADKPAKPEKSLILAVSGVLGLMLGVMVALVRRAYRNRKAAMSEVNS